MKKSDLLRVHVLQHVPFEGIGSMRRWLDERGARVSYTLFFRSPQLPPPTDFDLVIATGGPLSVNDEAALPWLKEEKRFIRDVICNGGALLGVCVGAQLIAAALGTRVYRNDEREIGWFPVEGVLPEPSSADLAPGGTAAEVPAGYADRSAGVHRATPSPNASAAACSDTEPRPAVPPTTSFVFPRELNAFHWHGETFELPPGARLLARSAACVNQAFQIGTNVVGLQFHLQATPHAVEIMIKNCRKDLKPGPFVQSEERLRSEPAESYERLSRLMGDVLDYITRKTD